MPQRRTAIKDLRKNHRNKMRNLDIKSDLKKTIKTFLTTVNSKKKDQSTTELSTLYKKLDKAAKRRVISKNTAARRKSRFRKLITTLA